MANNFKSKISQVTIKIILFFNYLQLIEKTLSEENINQKSIDSKKSYGINKKQLKLETINNENSDSKNKPKFITRSFSTSLLGKEKGLNDLYFSYKFPSNNDTKKSNIKYTKTNHIRNYSTLPNHHQSTNYNNDCSRSTSVNLNKKKSYNIDQLLEKSRKFTVKNKYSKTKMDNLKKDIKKFNLNSLLNSNLKFNFNRNNNNNNYNQIQRTITKPNEVNFYKKCLDNDVDDDFISNNKCNPNCNKDILFLLNDLKKELCKQNISNKPIKIKKIPDLCARSSMGNVSDVYKYNVLAKSKVLEIRDLRKDNNFFGTNKLSTSYNKNINSSPLKQDFKRDTFNINKYRNKKLHDIYNFLNDC